MEQLQACFLSGNNNGNVIGLLDGLIMCLNHLAWCLVSNAWGQVFKKLLLSFLSSILSHNPSPLGWYDIMQRNWWVGVFSRTSLRLNVHKVHSGYLKPCRAPGYAPNLLGKPVLHESSLTSVQEPGFKSQPCQLLRLLVSSSEKEDSQSLPRRGCYEDSK